MESAPLTGILSYNTQAMQVLLVHPVSAPRSPTNMDFLALEMPESSKPYAQDMFSETYLLCPCVNTHSAFLYVLLKGKGVQKSIMIN